jgi:poly(A)-specific ribonuclease
VGGDLSGIQPEWFQDKSKPQDLAILKQELDLVVLQIQAKPRHLIVGHNLFMDLAFLYKTFVGPLPKNVREFQRKVNDFFPMVIDTKYMATKDAGPMGPRHNLKELLAPFRKIHTPLIVLEEKHTSYGTSFGKEHEAGFDSWMTAELFVKMTAKLFFDRKEEFKHLPHISLPSDSLDSAFGGVNLWAPYPGDPDFIGEDENVPPEWHSCELNSITAVDPSKPSQWIPALNHEFWLAYANKLRVNAAEVGVCDLADGH